MEIYLQLGASKKLVPYLIGINIEAFGLRLQIIVLCSVAAVHKELRLRAAVLSQC